MGLSKDSVGRRVINGSLTRVLPRVFAVGGSAPTYRRDLLAAVLYAGEGSAASVSSAGREWGWEGFGAGTVEVSTVRKTIKAPWQMPSGREIIVHRVDAALLAQIELVGGIPVTSVPRTLLDLAGYKHRRVERALDDALQRRLVTLGQMWSFYEEEWIHGRRGVAILRSLLKDRTPDGAPKQSDLEDLFWKLVRDFRLPTPISQYPVVLERASLHVDFAYPDDMVAIECDGYAWHMDREAFERDRVRDNQLQGQGWIVLRYTWSQIRYRQSEVAAEIRFHLDRRRPLATTSA